MTVYALDTETTGITANDEVIQLAYIKVSPIVKETIAMLEHTDEMEKFSKYYKPRVSIHPKALEVHGISRLALINEDCSTTCKLPDDLRILIAHNAPFDFRMLAKTNEELLSSAKVICTQSLAKKIEKLQGGKFGFENYKLLTMYKFFYPDLAYKYETVHHDAMADCEMLLGVLIALLKAFPFLATLDEVYTFFWSK